ncbi:CdaR family transcriptional regulator [Aeribacillus alveayuensis]|jgi:carbohydrate diacid regulator|uniref:Carbohydrate diacid regulator n=1 Tax=Aeribacillus alveayuensis TaxID=279215 RepID=A0ABT9VJ40_9BACI|nr:carbohydrate diacid regulator [Bacillus alveayuensis]
MKITRQLAEPILAKLSEFLDYNINVMNDQGVIVASSDPSRIDQIHEGAIHVISNKKPLVISPDDLDRFAGSKPGVNLPIEFLGEIVGVVGVTGDPDELYKFARIIKITVEVMIQQVYVNNHLQYKNKLIENWIYDLIHPQLFDAKTLEQNGKHLLNIDFNMEMAVFLLHFSDLTISNGWENIDVMMKLNQKKDEILSGIEAVIPSVSFYSFIDNETCLVAIKCKGDKVVEEKQIAHKLHNYFKQYKLSLRIGIGNRAIGVEGYRDSYFQAKQSLELMRIFNSEKRSTHISEWKLTRLLASIPEKLRNEFIDQFFSGKHQLNTELIHTLEVLFNCQLKMKDTAEALHIHRNTLQYRLDRIQHQIGLDPRNFHDAVILLVLLYLMKINDYQ